MSQELNRVWGMVCEKDRYYYNEKEVDAVLAEKDKEIAELKARIQLDDDEMTGFLQLEEECGGGDLRNYIAELKHKLEDAKATHNAEMVDAGMRERRLKRALWMHRAITAKLNKEGCKAMREYNPFIGIEEYKWQEIERKCRAKAEEYK